MQLYIFTNFYLSIIFYYLKDETAELHKYYDEAGNFSVLGMLEAT